MLTITKKKSFKFLVIFQLKLMFTWGYMFEKKNPVIHIAHTFFSILAEKMNRKNVCERSFLAFTFFCKKLNFKKIYKCIFLHCYNQFFSLHTTLIVLHNLYIHPISIYIFFCGMLISRVKKFFQTFFIKLNLIQILYLCYYFWWFFWLRVYLSCYDAFAYKYKKIPSNKKQTFYEAKTKKWVKKSFIKKFTLIDNDVLEWICIFTFILLI